MQPFDDRHAIVPYRQRRKLQIWEIDPKPMQRLLSDIVMANKGILREIRFKIGLATGVRPVAVNHTVYFSNKLP